VDLEVFQQLVVSLGIGLLLGLERERRGASIAGIRTFPIISLFGTVCASRSSLRWLDSGAELLALAAVFVGANFIDASKRPVDPGTTTEIAALLLYVVGASIVIGHFTAALVIAGAARRAAALKVSAAQLCSGDGRT
jgi:MgtC family protein